MAAIKLDLPVPGGPYSSNDEWELFTFLHGDNHLLGRFIHAADSQALHVVVDACCKVAEAGKQHITHLVWNQLVHDAADQHHRRCNGCSGCDGLLGAEELCTASFCSKYWSRRMPASVFQKRMPASIYHLVG
uniref:Uncharacterized protein n=1 Tax=Oryza rufipogon TaxID=4529 RepID=A0A0E0PRY9_ORYRU